MSVCLTKFLVDLCHGCGQSSCSSVELFVCLFNSAFVFVNGSLIVIVSPLFKIPLFLFSDVLSLLFFFFFYQSVRFEVTAQLVSLR